MINPIDLNKPQMILKATGSLLEVSEMQQEAYTREVLAEKERRERKASQGVTAKALAGSQKPSRASGGQRKQSSASGGPKKPSSGASSVRKKKVSTKKLGTKKDSKGKSIPEKKEGHK